MKRYVLFRDFFKSLFCFLLIGGTTLLLTPWQGTWHPNCTACQSKEEVLFLILRIYIFFGSFTTAVLVIMSLLLIFPNIPFPFFAPTFKRNFSNWSSPLQAALVILASIFLAYEIIASIVFRS